MTKPEKQSGDGHRPLFTPILAAYLGVFLSGGAEMAYLPAVGPTPLRFRADLKPFVHKIELPVPPPPQPAVALPTNVVEKPAAVTAPVQPQTLPPATDTVEGVFDATQSDGVISPGMLLKYFNKSTNGATTGVIAPLDFVPPHAAEPPASKAEYSAPPQ